MTENRVDWKFLLSHIELCALQCTCTRLVQKGHNKVFWGIVV